MGRFNEELVHAGVMLAADGLRSSSQGKRVVFDGPGRTVMDAVRGKPRAVAGYGLWEVKDMDEIEVRPVYEMADFADAITPEVAELHERTREKFGGPLRLDGDRLA